MAINKRFPAVYDSEYVGGTGIREVVLFRRSASTSVNYVDADGNPVSRLKGFEDTNLTEDGRVNETGIILSSVGVSIKSGFNQPNQNEGYNELLFHERGYAELVLNDNQVVFTARLKDLVPRAALIASGSVYGAGSGSQSGSVTVNNMGLMYPADGIRIPRGVRFALVLRWERPLTLFDGRTARIEAEMWGRSDEVDSAQVPVPGPSTVPALALR